MPLNTMDAAIFLDKDGTLIDDVPYNVDPGRIRLAHRALEGVRLLTAYDYKLIVVTNQTGIARGLFSDEDLRGVASHINKLLAEIDVQLTGFYYCPHLLSAECMCRKPEPGLVLRAAEEHNIDLTRSWFVGDILNDIEAGRRAGCRTVLINNGNETEWLITPDRIPDYMVRNLVEAAWLVIQGLR
jgi:D-glycero-D-manno-heptose 1,7-bisphosphate phosphatase